MLFFKATKQRKPVIVRSNKRHQQIVTYYFRSRNIRYRWNLKSASSIHFSFIGSIATEYGDVGRYELEDRCCREHDLCPNTLLPGECKRGLCNQQPFTRSHCDCDAKFRRCLQGLNTGMSFRLNRQFSMEFD